MKIVFGSYGVYILSDVRKAILVFGTAGVLISNKYNLTLNSDAWFWFFSSIAQTFAALVALVAIFIISRTELYNVKINDSLKNIGDIFNQKIETIPETTIRSLLIFESKEIEKFNKREEMAKNRMRDLLEHAILIIVLSVLLLPLGSLTMDDNPMMRIWIDYKLKWFIIFGAVGLCIATLYKVESCLKYILKQRE